MDTKQRMRDWELVERLEKKVPPGDEDTLLALENLVHLLRLNNEIFEKLSDMMMPFGVTPAQFNVLAILQNANDHRSQMCDISARMCVTRTNITKLVDGLERAGFVRRVHSREDRRAVFAELTPAGLQLTLKLIPCHNRHVNGLWRALSAEDRLEMTHLLLKLQTGLQVEDKVPAEHSVHSL